MKSDYHIHSYFSTDSEAKLEDHCEAAIKNNINEICITDHVDYDVHSDQFVDYPTYFQVLRALQEKYKDQLTIKIGIEFGIQAHLLQQYTQDALDNPFDFILLSSHQIDNLEFWIYQYQKNKTQKEYNVGYYQNLLAIIKNYKHYSVLGHLDVIRRYDEAGEYMDDECFSLIKEILKVVIQDNKGIEINSSSFRYKLKDLMPSISVLKLYKELGGKIITLGSDSHTIESLCFHFDEIIEELKKIGFTEHYTFEHRIPIAHPFD